jgi:GNAT superfamily N-acetyltransferase
MNIYQLQKLCYPQELHEDGDFLAKLYDLSKATSFIEYCTKGYVKGYCICHYLESDKIPDLGSFDGVKAVGNANDTLFIHDICIHPFHRNEGLGSTFVRKIRDFPSKRIIGVAVNGSHLFWLKMGAYFTGQSCCFGDVFELPKGIFIESRKNQQS